MLSPSYLALYSLYDPSVRLPSVCHGCGCPRCVFGNEKRRNNALMDNMPKEAYRALYDQIMVPFLLQVHAFNAELFPREWITDPPAQKPKCRVSLLFHHMCSCMRLYQECEGNMPEGVIFSIRDWGRCIFSKLVRRKRSRWTAEEIRLDAQIHELGGVNSAYHLLNKQAIHLGQGGHCDLPPCKVAFTAQCMGALPEMLKVARMLYCHYMECETDGDNSLDAAMHSCVLVYLGKVVDWLALTVEQEEERAVAVAMALHPRLGEASPLLQVGSDLLPYCMPASVVGLNRWTDVLKRWLASDINE